MPEIIITSMSIQKGTIEIKEVKFVDLIMMVIPVYGWLKELTDKDK